MLFLGILTRSNVIVLQHSFRSVTKKRTAFSLGRWCFSCGSEDDYTFIMATVLQTVVLTFRLAMYVFARWLSFLVGNMRLLGNHPSLLSSRAGMCSTFLFLDFALITNHLFLVYYVPSILLIMGDTIVNHEDGLCTHINNNKNGSKCTIENIWYHALF